MNSRSEYTLLCGGWWSESVFVEVDSYRTNRAKSLSEKVKVIESKENNKPLVREIMLKFKCGKTQIYKTLKHKDKIVSVDATKWPNE